MSTANPNPEDPLTLPPLNEPPEDDPFEKDLFEDDEPRLGAGSDEVDPDAGVDSDPRVDPAVGDLPRDPDLASGLIDDQAS